MNTRKLILTSLLALVLLVLSAAPALAAGPMDGRIVFGDDFTLEAGEVLYGDLVVFGGTVDLEESSRVAGDVAVMGGSADVAGTVGGDLVIFGGSVDLKSTAIVEGQLVTFGGSIERAEGAEVKGSQVEGFSFGEDFDWQLPGIARVWRNDYGYNWDHWLLRALFRAFKVLVSAVLVVIVGALAAVLMPRQLERASQAVLSAPVTNWMVGFATAVLAAIVSTVLFLTLCLSPFGAILLLLLLAAGVFGWAALGLVVGSKVLEKLKTSNMTPVMATTTGTAILSLVAAAMWLLSDCCLGWPFVVVIGSFGLGGVVLTRFGRQEYVPTTETALVPQPPVDLAQEEGEYLPPAPEAVEESDES